MNTEPGSPQDVDPIAFTKARVAEIGEAWKSFALHKKAEAISRVEGSLDRAPAAVKRWLKLSPEAPTSGSEPGSPPAGNGSTGPSADMHA